MRRQSGVFARKNAALVGHKLLEQRDVLVVQRVERKVDFRLRAGGADFERLRPCRGRRVRLVFRDEFFVAWEKGYLISRCTVGGAARGCIS